MMCIDGKVQYHKFGCKYMISEDVILKYFGMTA